MQEAAARVGAKLVAVAFQSRPQLRFNGPMLRRGSAEVRPLAEPPQGPPQLQAAGTAAGLAFNTSAQPSATAVAGVKGGAEGSVRGLQAGTPTCVGVGQ